LRNNTTRKKNTKIPFFTKTQIELYEKIISNTSLKSSEAKYTRANRSSRNFSKNADEIANNINAFAILVGIFREHSIELIANIIYSNSKIVLVSRYIFYNKEKYTEKQMPPSLYLNKCRPNVNSGLLITSEPLFKYDSVLFPENTVTVLDYQKNKLDIHKIL
jgi:hypothetical protein